MPLASNGCCQSDEPSDRSTSRNLLVAVYGCAGHWNRRCHTRLTAEGREHPIARSAADRRAPPFAARQIKFQPITPAMMVATAPNTPSQHKDTITSSIVAFIIPPAPKVRANETTNVGGWLRDSAHRRGVLARECFHLMAWPKRRSTAFLEGS